jgi:hypothetical protein
MSAKCSDDVHLSPYGMSTRRIFSLLLLGYGNCPAIHKGDIARKMKPHLCVYDPGNFHAFYHFTVA